MPLVSDSWRPPSRVIRGRRGKAKAIGAVRHDILIAFWHIATRREPYRDLGPDWHQRRYSPRSRPSGSSASSNPSSRVGAGFGVR
jgi:hypothetical protein